jgi:hypothetical protein
VTFEKQQLVAGQQVTLLIDIPPLKVGNLCTTIRVVTDVDNEMPDDLVTVSCGSVQVTTARKNVALAPPA